MNIIREKLAAIMLLFLLIPLLVQAGGISVDAGLTPGQDRWIIKTQYRYMKMQNPAMSIRNQLFPVMVAYGVTSNFTVLARSVFVTRTIDLTKTENKKGFNDPFVLFKFKVLRINTAKYVLGIAPFIASNIPIGSKDISQRTWNPELGLSMSFRPRFWSVDFTASYTASDITKKMDVTKNDILSLNIAFSSMIPLKNSNSAISPVMELTYSRDLDFKDGDNTLPEIVFISPGFMCIKSSLVFEVLFQYPFSEQTNPQNMESKSRIIAGLRFMF